MNKGKETENQTVGWNHLNWILFDPQHVFLYYGYYLINSFFVWAHSDLEARRDVRKEEVRIL